MGSIRVPPSACSMASCVELSRRRALGGAWEAAWIACLATNPAWAVTAEQEFGDVLTELHGVIWTVRRDIGGHHRSASG